MDKRITLADNRYVIAADRGFAYLEVQGISADLVVGDFDSLGRIPDHPNLIAHPPEKDDTDMMLAVKEGLRRGYRTFFLYGGMGGRLDHTLANLQTLAYLSEQNAAGYLIGEGTAVTAIKNGGIFFPNTMEGLLSVFCHGDYARGVCLKGLKYELNNAELTPCFPVGVSNEFIGQESSVSVSDGTLLVLWSHDETQALDYVGTIR